ncbi:MAG TPA: copper homeostasis protein CutC [Caldilineaceae bacterium]|nr:copper homeostasis protein CutC [Caldilineaceae bacterium]
MITLEVCVDSVEGAIAAQRGGAHRVELCANLFEGGVTPSAGAIELARRHLTIGLHVLIRPRGGDFCYSALEFEVMRRDIEIAKSLGADGVVLGLLLPDGTVDEARTGALVKLARPLSITFHRALDMAADPASALETLIRLGIERVLTSGQEPSALEGAETIAALVRQAQGRIAVMAGGGIHERNIARIVKATNVSEVHLSARMPVESAMQFRNSRVPMGGALHPPEFHRLITSAERVSACLRALAA